MAKKLQEEPPSDQKKDDDQLPEISGLSIEGTPSTSGWKGDPGAGTSKDHKRGEKNDKDANDDDDPDKTPRCSPILGPEDDPEKTPTNCSPTPSDDDQAEVKSDDDLTMLLPYLPQEIYEEIFKKADGRTLARCRLVCHRFRAIIDNLQRVYDLWYHCCLREMPDEAIDELNRNHSFHTFKQFREQPRELQLIRSNLCNETGVHIRHVYRFGENYWYNLYQKWARCGSLDQLVARSQEISGFSDNPVSCARISGNIILTGHQNGDVLLFDPADCESKVLMTHLRIVTDIALVDLVHHGHYRIHRSRSGSFSHHHHIITVSKDRYVKIFPLLSNEHVRQESCQIWRPAEAELRSVRVFDDKLAVFSQNSAVSVWRMSLCEDTVQNKKQQDDTDRFNVRLNLQIIAVIVTTDDIPINFGIWGDHVYTLCGTGYMSNVNLKDNLWRPRNRFKLNCERPALSGNRGQAVQYIERSFMFRGGVAIVCSVSGSAFYTLDGGRTMQELMLNRRFNAKMMSCKLRNGLLCVGLASGELWIYSCPDTNHLTKLHCKQPIFKKSLNEGSVEPINEIDFCENDEMMLMICVTPSSVKFLKFFPKSMADVVL